MLLTVDVGNTKTALALWRGGELVGVCQARTSGEGTDWLGFTRAFLTEHGARVRGLALASVVPAALARWLNVALGLGVELRVFDGSRPLGVSIEVDEPLAVGPDRLMNVLGALDWSPPALIAVGFGTATIFDVVDENHRYLGGAIAPGAGTALTALVERTARLPAVELEAPERAIGRNTVEAMQSGAVLGYVGLVEGLLTRIRAELGTSAFVVATGGLAPKLAPLCAGFDKVDVALTHRGLRRAWEAGR